MPNSNIQTLAVTLRALTFEELVGVSDSLREMLNVGEGFATEDPSHKYVLAEVLSGWAKSELPNHD